MDTKFLNQLKKLDIENQKLKIMYIELALGIKVAKEVKKNARDLINKNIRCRT